MSMTIVNNNVASMALGELNKNINKLGKELAKISSGRRINSAQDDASVYDISKKMRAHIRALVQDMQNAQNGTSLVKVAEGGIQDIIEELREMKAMALDSASAHNSNSDRKTIQKVFSRYIEGIDDIAASTNYNGIPLLDGRWWGHDGISSSSSSGAVNPIGNYTPVPQPVRPSSGISPTIIPYGDYTITQDGVYQLDYGYEGKVTISAENVEIRQSNWPYALQGDISFECTRDNTNLWLNRVNVTKTSPGSFIRFGPGTDNTLNLVGGNQLSRHNIHDMNGEASVNVGGGLTIFDGDGTGSFGVGGGYSQPQPLMMGAIIGSDANENSMSNITINGGNISLHLGNPTGIGSGANGSIGNIYINGGNIFSTSEGGNFDPDNTRTGAAIGSGYMGTVEGSIVINGGTITAASDCAVNNAGLLSTTYGGTYGSGAGIGAGANGIVKGKIIIRDGLVNAYAAYGAAIGTGTTFDDGDTSVGRIFINGGEIHAKSEFGSAIGTGSNWEGYNPTVIRTPVGTVGSITVNGGTYSTAVNNNNVPPIRFYRSMYDRVLPDVTGEDEPDFLPQTETISQEGNPLRIHVGPKSNENIAIFINNMHSDAMGLSDVIVDPLEKALEAIDKLDVAIDYALNENTRMGVYQARIKETIDTLETRITNNMDAQSTITDADMAKEMIEYAKINMLSQSSQAMFAQANKSFATVLSLLQ